MVDITISPQRSRPDPVALAAARAACDEIRPPDALIETIPIPSITVDAVLDSWPTIDGGE